MSISINIANLPEWEDLTYGAHTLTVRAKAPGYRDSNASTGVSFSKVALEPPTATLSGDFLDIQDNDGNATAYKIYLNGQYWTTVNKTLGGE